MSAKSVYQWRRAWRAGGDAALASRGPGGYGCKLDERQLARLRAALNAGPAAYGWDADQRWTLARVAVLIARLCGVSYTLRGASCLLYRLGYGPQVPVHHRAAEREGAWSVMKNGLGNLAAGTTSQLAAAMRHQLDRIQKRPALIADSSARPDSPSNQNRPDTQTHPRS